VAEAARDGAPPWDLLGFIDDEPCARTVALIGIARLGDERALAGHSGAMAVLGFGGIGPNPKRAQAVARISPRVAGWGIVVHRTAYVSRSATIGPGTVVMPGAIVHAGAEIGSHCIVNSGALIEHDVRIADYAMIAPRATIGGGARVGEGSFVGLGAIVRDHISIGREALVAMGAAVTGDVADEARVRGVPAR
jgi:acetyltransferase EpsM